MKCFSILDFIFSAFNVIIAIPFTTKGDYIVKNYSNSGSGSTALSHVWITDGETQRALLHSWWSSWGITSASWENACFPGPSFAICKNDVMKWNDSVLYNYVYENHGNKHNREDDFFTYNEWIGSQAWVLISWQCID